MAHITLSVPDETYDDMKKHPEIKWSEIARQSIIQKTLSLKKEVSSQELFSILSANAKKNLAQLSDEKAVAFAKGSRKEGLKRQNYLTQA